MTELSDYRRLVEAPMVESYERRISALAADVARLKTALEDARAELVVGSAFAMRGQPNEGVIPYPNLAKRMYEASERAATVLDGEQKRDALS